jgi:hypothetical protein
MMHSEENTVTHDIVLVDNPVAEEETKVPEPFSKGSGKTIPNNGTYM